MGRVVVLSGMVSFLMEFLGAVAAFSLVVPSMVEAEQQKITGTGFGVIGANGTEQVTLATRPTGGGVIQESDADGNARISMATGGNAPGGAPNAANAGISLLATDGTVLGRLGTLSQGTWGLRVADSAGNQRLTDTVDDQGTPSVTLSGADGTDRIRMITGPADKSLIAALDANGTQRVELAVGGSNGTLLDAESLNVDDVSHNEIAQLGTSASTPGRGHLRLSDADARPRLVLNVADDGTPSIQMFDAAGNVTWSAQ